MSSLFIVFLRPSLASERRVEARLRHERPRHLRRLSLGSSDGQMIGRGRLQATRKLQPSAHGLPHPTPHVLADRPREHAIRLELAVQARRGDLEVVALRNKPRHVQHVRRLVTQPLAVEDAGASRLVHEEPQGPAPGLPAPLQVHELEPVGFEDRGHYCLDLSQKRLPVNHPRVHFQPPPAPYRTKKWATPTFVKTLAHVDTTRKAPWPAAALPQRLRAS